MTSRFDSSGEAGFTLVEILVVIAILGLMTTLILSNGMPVSPAVHGRAVAQAVSGALRQARSEAMASNRSVSFTLDVANHVFQLSGGPTEHIPPDLQLSLLTSEDEVMSDEKGRIRFDPDGGSTGGRISITGGGQVWQVGVDWLSGHVTIQTHKPKT
jgi:general secretion pathway protein H